jgi:hypothetical protein
MHRLTRWVLHFKHKVPAARPRLPPLPSSTIGQSALIHADVAGNPARERQPLIPLGAGEPGADLLLPLTPEFERLVEDLPAELGQVQLAGPPVRRMRAPLQQALLLQVIDEGHHLARRNLQPEGHNSE